MKTIQDHWKEYWDAVYPNGAPTRQNLECHQAFFAGAFVALGLMHTIADLPDDEGLQAINKLNSEVMEVCQFRLKTLQDQN